MCDRHKRQRRMSLGRLVAFMVLACLVFLPDGAALAAEKLRFGTASQPPFTRDADGAPGALDALYSVIFGRLGLDVEIMKLPAERALINANAGLDDGDAFRVAGLEKRYPNLVSVPESVFSVEFVLITREGAGGDLDWAALEGRSVGIINGWKIAESNLAGVANLTRVSTPRQLFELLQRGRVDFIVFTRQAGHRYIRTETLKGLEIQKRPLARRDMYLYLNDKHADLAGRVAVVLRGMKASGEYKAIIQRYLPEYFALN